MRNSQRGDDLVEIQMAIDLAMDETEGMRGTEEWWPETLSAVETLLPKRLWDRASDILDRRAGCSLYR